MRAARRPGLPLVPYSGKEEGSSDRGGREEISQSTLSGKKRKGFFEGGGRGREISSAVG